MFIQTQTPHSLRFVSVYQGSGKVCAIELPHLDTWWERQTGKKVGKTVNTLYTHLDLVLYSNYRFVYIYVTLRDLPNTCVTFL